MSQEAAGTGIRVTDEMLSLPAGLAPETTYDVLLNHQHVWSLQPARDTELVGGALVVAWPDALHRHLRGRARVTVRAHVDTDASWSTDHVFRGDTSRTVAVTDSDGNPLVLDKYLRLIRPLSSEVTGTLDELLDIVEDLLRDLRERAGVPAFVSYGTLLGAVRNGELIGHDNDIDLTFVSLGEAPVDVVRDGYRVERALLAAGWHVRRGSGARLNVRVRLSDGSVRFIDVFTAHWVEGVLYTPSDTGFPLPRETLLPLGEVRLHGRTVPAPADPERLLEATYGPSWRTPDPSFRYETPRWLSRRLNGWFGGLRTHRKHWDKFNSGPGSDVPLDATRFARWVWRNHGSEGLLVDVGTGNGRDALHFARKGRPVLALDYSLGATAPARRRAERKGLDLTFASLNLYDARETLALGARLSREEVPVDVYARFMVHSLEEQGQVNLVRLASMALRRGGHLFLEFRTEQDADLPHHFGDYSRRYADPDEVVRMLEAAGGRIVHRREGTGMAMLEDEDPHVCRLVASFARG